MIKNNYRGEWLKPLIRTLIEGEAREVYFQVRSELGELTHYGDLPFIRQKEVKAYNLLEERFFTLRSSDMEKDRRLFAKAITVLPSGTMRRKLTYIYQIEGQRDGKLLFKDEVVKKYTKKTALKKTDKHDEEIIERLKLLLKVREEIG